MIYIALIGVTLIIVRGTIFRGLQEGRLSALFACSQCTGFWVGVAAGATQLASMGHGAWVDAILIGATTSFLSMAADAVLLKLLGDPNE